MKNSGISLALLATMMAPIALADWTEAPAPPEAPEPPKAQLQQQLNDTRDELRVLSERLAVLSLKLVDEPLTRVQEALSVAVDRSGRAAIGATITSVGGVEGAKVLAVTPDGPADDAGLRTGDVILEMGDVRFDGKDLAASEQLARFMRDIEVGDAINVNIDRDGDLMSLSINAEPLSGHDVFAFSFDGDIDIDSLPDEVMSMNLPGVRIDGERHFEFFFMDGPWADMEVVALTPGLADYFGVSDGLLVVRAPEDDSVDLRDGDVIVRVDGDTLDNRRSLERTLSQRKAEQTVRFDIVRQRASMTVEAVVPEGQRAHRQNKAGVFMHKRD
ncbi:MAG: PDZ domain-containing protein [Gammaproteobacteria bacterium]